MIQTTVARVISPTTVVLAAGSEQGVREGTTFVIFAPGPLIKDPENGESLGHLEIVKGRVRATHVQDKLCIATTFTRVMDWLRPFTLPSRIVEHEQLQVEGAVDLETDQVVRVGDRARSVEEPLPVGKSIGPLITPAVSE